MQHKVLFVFRLHPSKVTKAMRQFRMRGLDGYLPTMTLTKAAVKRSQWNGAERRISLRIIEVGSWTARLDD
jgi:hypothetical protein